MKSKVFELSIGEMLSLRGFLKATMDVWEHRRVLAILRLPQERLERQAPISTLDQEAWDKGAR